jgi:hypothetical protein
MHRLARHASVGAALVVAAGALVAGGVVPANAGGSGGASVTVVASHLNNPRGLAWGNGALYVAEAGRGGTTHCITDPTGSQSCVGTTSSISRVTWGHRTRIVRGLVSVASPGGIGAEGLVAVSVDRGHLYGQMFGAPQEIPPGTLPHWLARRANAQLGQFGKVWGGRFHARAGVGAADFRWTARHQQLVPDQFPDANPNGLLVRNGLAYVADAGANTLSVAGHGWSKVAAFLGTRKGSDTDAVPTCVAQGPDHAYYVGELLGGYYAPGHARVWRLWRDHGTWQKAVWARGLTTVQGCGFDRAGNFYATQFQTGGLNEDPSASPLGNVVKIAPDGTRTTLGDGQLFWPSGFAAGPDGSIYVSNCSIAPASGFGPCPKGGQVVRIKE